MVDEKDLDSLKERADTLRAQRAGGNGLLNAGKSERAAGAPEKPVGPGEKSIGKQEGPSEGPVGLDIGTSHIVAAQKKFNYIEVIQELNAFFTVPNTKFARDFLHQKDVMYYEHENKYYIFGYSAESFANMFNTDTRRSMKNGIISPKEEEGIAVISAIINTLIQKPKNFGEILCFVIPGEPLQGTGSVVYHESIIKRIVGGLGYSPISINEGMAIVASELSNDDYTGIGISMGGGMCNVCLSYLSFPVITYSIQTAGDFIDEMVGTSVGEPATKIKVIKEEELDLSGVPKDRLITALHIFYDELIHNLLESLQRVLNSEKNIPRIKAPIPIVLTGGTAMPKGCKEKFEDMLKKISLPVEISEVRLAEDPLNTNAKGALIMAMTEAG